MPHTESETSGEGPPPRVLVVDDEESVVEMYTATLPAAYDVVTATSGARALDVVDDGFDVVVLDRRMSEISGDEVLEAIHRRGIDCHIIMVTAVEPDSSVIDLQWTDYVVKPIRPEALREVVERGLRIVEYSDRRRELTSKKLRRNVLEVELDAETLEDSAEYQRLLADIERLETEIATLEDGLERQDIERVL